MLSSLMLHQFPYPFYSFSIEVHRSSAKTQGLFFSVFIHRILLDLGLEDFPVSELVHIIAPIGATFLRQRAAQLKASFKRPRVESSTSDASRVPLQLMILWTSLLPWILHHRFLSFRRRMDNSLDVLNELVALRANLAVARGSFPPAPPSDES